MKITICGSMYFAKKMLEAKNQLEKLQHSVYVSPDAQKFIDEPDFTTDNHEANRKHAVENDIIRKFYNLIAASDAILVLNYPKNGISGYVGASVLMEIGLAYYLNKKIFLFFPPPPVTEAKYSHELSILQPTILNGDLTKIK